MKKEYINNLIYNNVYDNICDYFEDYKSCMVKAKEVAERIQKGEIPTRIHTNKYILQLDIPDANLRVISIKRINEK